MASTWRESMRMMKNGCPVTVAGGMNMRNSRFSPWWKVIFIAGECNGIDDEVKSFIGARIDDRVFITGGVHEAGEGE